jgi:hypothetical protein
MIMAATPAQAKSKALGPRVSVLVGQVTRNVNGKPVKANVYSYMLKSTAEYFGFKAVNAQTTPARKASGAKKSATLVRGTVGAGSIKVPVATAATGTGTKGKGSKYRRIPMPSGLTLAQIQAFLTKATKNKPQSFVSKNGRTYPVTVKTAAGK